MTAMPVTIAARIKQLRERTGESQQVFSTKAGISTPTLNRLEGGRIEPTLGTLQQIANMLGLTLAELVEGVEVPPDQPLVAAPAAETA